MNSPTAFSRYRVAILGMGLTFMLNAFANPAARSLERFAKRPTPEGLRTFTAACRNHALSAEILRDAARRLKEQANPLALRGLLRLRRFCASGDLARDLNTWIGTDLLLTHPEALLRALAAEKLPPPFLSELAEAWDAQGAGPFRNCDPGCLPAIHEFYRKKKEALTKLDMSGFTDAELWTRIRLLNFVDEAWKHWKFQLEGR